MGKNVYILVILTVMLAAATASAVSFPELRPDKYVSPSQSKPFEESRSLKVDHAYGEPLPAIPDRLQEKRTALTLVDLIDAAMEINPKTAASWYSAKASAAQWGAKKGLYYPQISDIATVQGGKTQRLYNQKSYFDNNLSLNYLLFDFGNRSQTAEAAKQALINSNLMFNQTVLDILRDVPKAYYLLIGTKALVSADEKNLDEARVSLNAAEQRRLAGVGTIADVLQARANEAQAMLNLASDKGQVEVAKGALATAVGWPANTKFDILGEIMKVPIGKLEDTIDDLIEEALKNRPELAGVIARVKAKEAELKVARSLYAPKLYGTANFDYFKSRDYGPKSYYGGVNLQIPIFEGFSIVNQVRQAKANLSKANEELKISKEAIITDTWNANYDFITSLKQVDAAKALLASADQSYEVSLGRYKAGAADIVELMTVQSQLWSARAQLINAKTNLHINYAELIHAVGTGFQNPLEMIDYER